MRQLLFIAGIVFVAAAPAQQQVYKTTDAAGNVIYSDQPSEGAEVIDIQEVQTYESLAPAPPPPTLPETQADSPYNTLAVTSPTDDESVRQNDGNVSIDVALDPGLDGGDLLVIYVDGKKVSSGKASSVTLENMDRGTHEVRAQVVSADGKPRISSPTTKFHVLRHSAQHPPPGNAGKPTPKPAPAPAPAKAPNP